MGSPSEWESRVSSVHDRLTLRRRGKGEKAFHFYEVAVIPRSRLERLTSSLLVKRSTTELAGICLTTLLCRYDPSRIMLLDCEVAGYRQKFNLRERSTVNVSLSKICQDNRNHFTLRRAVYPRSHSLQTPNADSTTQTPCPARAPDG